MAEPPLVTIVIPTWNRLQLVQQAIASVAAQTCPDWELIVADDGSTDGTVEQLRRIDEPRLRVLESAHTGDAGRLRDLGAAAGTGEWLAFLDSDDLWVPEKLEFQLEALARSGAEWCYSTYILIDENGAAIPLRSGEIQAISGWIIDDLLAGRTCVHADTLLVRRPLFESLGGFGKNGLLYCEDLDFAFRLSLAAEAVAVADPLARVRDHAGRSTASIARADEQAARVYDLLLPRLSESRSLRLARRKRAHHLAEAGAERLSRHEFGPGLRLLAKAAPADHPSHWLRSAARGLRSLLTGR